MTTKVNKMVDKSLENVNEDRQWYQRWIVQLVHGIPGEAGVIVEQEYVTKKWERVEDLMLRYSEKSQTLPQHEFGEWYVTVEEIVPVSVGDFTMPFIEQGRDAYA